MKAEQGKNTKMFSDEEYKLKLERLKEVKQPGNKWLPQDYALVSKYDVLEVEKDGQILQRLVKVDKKDGSRKRYTTYEQLFDAIKEYHEENGKHTGRLLTFKKLKIIFANITMQQVILFIECCETCHQKQGRVKKGIVVKPIVSSKFNSRCQVDCIDMQSCPDGEYRYIMVYQDHLTKFTLLEPLKTKSAQEVATNLISVFKTFSAPLILHSDNGREFVNKVIHELLLLWPACKMVNGKARHSQSQGSVERCNRDIEAMLACWRRDHKRNDWATGLTEIQYSKNTRHHTGIGRSPFKAMFGMDPMMGIESLGLEKELTSDLETEEQLEAMFPEEALENDDDDDVEKLLQDIPSGKLIYLIIFQFLFDSFK